MVLNILLKFLYHNLTILLKPLFMEPQLQIMKNNRNNKIDLEYLL